MAAFGGVIGPEQDVEPEAPDPETFGRPQVMTRPGDTYGTRRQRLHDPILAEPARVRWHRGWPGRHSPAPCPPDRPGGPATPAPGRLRRAGHAGRLAAGRDRGQRAGPAAMPPRRRPHRPASAPASPGR